MGVSVRHADWPSLEDVVASASQLFHVPSQRAAEAISVAAEKRISESDHDFRWLAFGADVHPASSPSADISRRRTNVKKGLAMKTGAAALALSVLAGNAAQAMCADQHEMAALRAAALRQHLMVAALTCHEASYFNQFVTSYRAEYLESDRELLRFFAREGSGDAGYNAYKTKEANDSSLTSMHDPNFCGTAQAAFEVALHDNLPLEELATQEATLVHTGFEGCSRSADATTFMRVRTAANADASAKATPAVDYKRQPDARYYVVPVYYR